MRKGAEWIKMEWFANKARLFSLLCLGRSCKDAFKTKE